jgi:hypothetical protein
VGEEERRGWEEIWITVGSMEGEDVDEDDESC